MRIYFLVKAIIIFISIQRYRSGETDLFNKTTHFCRCPNNNLACATGKISCAGGGNVHWIGFRYFGFGLLEMGNNCSAIDSSTLIPIPNGTELTRNITIDKRIMEKYSGHEKKGELQSEFSVNEYYHEPNAYFIANYDCIYKKPGEEDALQFDQKCSYHKTAAKLNLWSESYPNVQISTSKRSCSCNLTITSTRLLLRTYDNRLVGNQLLLLSNRNQTLIKRWEMARSIKDMINVTDLGPFSSEQFVLNWENNATSAGGKLWIVIEAVDGNITTVCQNYDTMSPTTVATPALTSPSAALNHSRSPSNSSLSLSSTTQKTSNLTQAVNVTSMPLDIRSTKSPPQASNVQGMSSVPPSRSNGLLTSLTSNIFSKTPAGQAVTQTQKPGDSSKPNDGKVNIGTLIGIIVAGLFVLILLILCCIFYCLKKKQQRTEPQRGTQPGNNKFNRDRVVKDLPNEGNRHGKLQSKQAVEQSSNNSITNNSLPPLPMGRNDIISQKNEFGAHQGPVGVRQNGKVTAHDTENARLSQNLHAKLFEDISRTSSHDTVPLTENTFNKRNNIGELENTVSDAQDHEQEKKKKKKKKKKRKKKNTIEALLEEENTSYA